MSPSLAERGAARLAHRSGGPGVGGSNPLAPTSVKSLNELISYLRKSVLL